MTVSVIIEPNALRSRPAFGRRAADRIAVILASLSIVAMMTITPAVLTSFGVAYAASGGSQIGKIHPATFLAVAALIVLAVGRGDPVGFVVRRALVSPGLVAFGSVVGLLFFHVVAISLLPVSPIIDTFVLPILLFPLIEAMDDRDRRRLAVVLVVLFVANALIGLGEYGTGWRLTPLYDADGHVLAYDWRASALFGHPLSNAFLDGVFLLAFAVGAVPRLPPVLRFGLMGLAVVAFVAFGGRVAMVFGIVFLVAIGLVRGTGLLLGGRFRLSDAVLGIAAVTVAILVLVVFIDMGAADRFIDRFSSDQGSAQARVAMFRVFGDLTPEQFLLWSDQGLLAKAQREFGIRVGVESSEVAFVAFYGLFTTIVFFAGLALFLAELVRARGRRALWLVFYFAVVMSGSNGIAAKTLALAQFTALVLLLMPRPPGAAPQVESGAVAAEPIRGDDHTFSRGRC